METPPPEDHSFTPANDRLISVYLRRRIAGEKLPPATAAHFHDVDIYAAEPATLTAGLQPVPAGKGEASSWLFFTLLRSKSSTDSRKSSKVGGGLGTWHSEHAPEDVVDDEGNRVGHRKLFSYKDKGGRRSGWSMWEFVAADQEGGESLLVLCKIHQTHTGSRHADGSAARSARKRKGTDDGVDQVSAPVRRRLLAPPAPIPPAVSQCKIGAASEAIPCSKTETEASKSKDAPRSVLSFWDEPATPLDKINASSSSVRSFSPKPDAAHEKIISTTMESPASFLIPEPEAPQAEMATFDRGFLMDGGAPPVPEHIYTESFMDGSGAKGSGVPLCAPAAGLSGSWIGHDNTPFCYGGNAFLGGLPTYEEFGAGASGSWNGYNTAASWIGGNAFINGLPTYNEQGISGSAGLEYGCAMPSATPLPSAASSQW